MIDVAWMENELDQFYSDYNGRKNMKLLIDFEDSKVSIDEGIVPRIDFGKPKMKKKLIASKFIPLKKGRGTLF